MRGTNIAPHFLPAQFWDTRIQQELFSSFFPSRSQWNCTFTRPYWSTKISSPEGPTTTAVCEPCTTGWGVGRTKRRRVRNAFEVILVVEIRLRSAVAAAEIARLAGGVTQRGQHPSL